MAKGKDLILSLLYKGDLSGYQITEIISKRLSHFIQGTPGIVYPVLRNLEREGFATSKTVIQDTTPNKKVYSITTAGKQRVKDFLSTAIARDEFKSDFLFRVYLGIDMTTQDYMKLIESERNSLEERLDELLGFRPALAEMDANIRYAYDFGIATYRAQLDFLATHPVPSAAPGESRG